MSAIQYHLRSKYVDQQGIARWGLSQSKPHTTTPLCALLHS